MTKERYLMMCEQMGSNPIEEEIPAEFEDFPYSVQIAITIYHILEDRFDGFSGTYFGKNYVLLPYLAKLYKVEDEKQLLEFLLLIDRMITTKRSEEQKRKRKKTSSKKGGISIQG